MATDVDTWEVKKQIVSILEADTTLFSTTGAGSKVRKIEAGAPRMSELVKETTLPHIWITNDSVIETIRIQNSTEGNAPNVTEHTMNFKIIIMIEQKDGFDAEEVLDDFVKLIKQDITANYDLRDPGGAESTSVADSCEVRQVSQLDPVTVGRKRHGQIISLRVMVTTG